MHHFNSAALRLTYGFGIKPGVLLSPRTLLFADLALVEGRFSFNQTSNYDTGFVGGISLPISGRKTVGAWQFGMGIENHFSRHWSVFLKYLYTHFFQTISVHTNGVAANGVIITDTVIYHRIAFETFLAGVNYYFKV